MVLQIKKEILQLIQQTNLHSGPLTQKGFYRNVCTWNCYRHISISGEHFFKFLIVLDAKKYNLSNSTGLCGKRWLRRASLGAQPGSPSMAHRSAQLCGSPSPRLSPAP